MKRWYVVCLFVAAFLCLQVPGWATAYTWSNALGDNDFLDVGNWLSCTEILPGDDMDINLCDGDEAVIGLDGLGAVGRYVNVGKPSGSCGELSIIAGETYFSNGVAIARTDNTSQGSFTVSGGDFECGGYFTVGDTGAAVVELSGTGSITVNRNNVATVAGSSANVSITDGTYSVATYMRCGLHGEALIDMSGGILNNYGTTNADGGLNLGYYNDGSCLWQHSGTAEANVAGTLVIGRTGEGTIELSGGMINAEKVSFATEDDPNSIGSLIMTGGEFNSHQYFTIADKGDASVDISGGFLNVNRSILGQNSSAVGSMVFSGGEACYENYLRVGSAGQGSLTFDGAGGKLRCGDFYAGPLSTVNFVLDGSAGVGSGIESYDDTVRCEEGAVVDVSFASGTDVPGSFVVLNSPAPITYLSSELGAEPVEVLGDVSSVLLSASAASAGWVAEVINSGSGAALLVTSPVASTNGMTWNSGSVTLSSALTADIAVVGDDAAASLDIASGADADFINLTIGNAATGSGQVNMTGGAVDVASMVFIGKDGVATLDISSGAFSAGNIIAASSDGSSADVQVGGDASLYVEGVVALGAGAELTFTGYQTSINIGSMTTAEDSVLTFEIDGALGVGNAVNVAGHVSLNGSLDVNFVAGNRVDGTYTVIRSEKDIFDNTGGNLVSTSFVTYEIVEVGDYKELQLTVFTPSTCQDVIDAGFTLAGDLTEDCQVDLFDFAAMASQWLWCNDPTLPECDWLTQ